MPHILSFPDELLDKIVDASGGRSDPDVALRLASVCQQFRRIVLGDVYKTIVYSDATQRILLDILPFHHGQLVRTLEVRLGEPGGQAAGDLLDGLARILPHLSHLKHFILKKWPTGNPLSPVYHFPRPVRVRSDMVSLGLRLAKCFEGLSPLLEELEVRGFPWKGTAKALCATVQMPHLTRLVLGLELDSQPNAEDSTFMHSFPNLKDLTLPPIASCPQALWFSRAFGSVKIENLEILKSKPAEIVVTVMTPVANVQDVGRDDSEGLVSLCASSASSLRTISLRDQDFPCAKVSKYFRHVTSIEIAHINFRWRQSKFDALVGPLASLPALGSLRLVNCSDISTQMVNTWFTLGSPRKHFRALSKLAVGELKTLGDDVDMPPALIAEGQYWGLSQRFELFSNCEEVGIELELKTTLVRLPWL